MRVDKKQLLSEYRLDGDAVAYLKHSLGDVACTRFDTFIDHTHRVVGHIAYLDRSVDNFVGIVEHLDIFT